MRKIPVYIISGFLGSGKTTVLLNMIKECERNHKRPGIILNELGEINVENHLFENHDVKELLNGCICCTIQDDLKGTLNEFVEGKSKDLIDVLFIEGTGVANPLEIKDALQGPRFIEYFELYSIISLVDASQFLEYQSIFSSTTEVRKLLKDQISSSSIVLLNKTDLIKEKALNKIKDKVKETVKSDVPIYKTTFGAIPMKELFLKRYNVHFGLSSSSKPNISSDEKRNHAHHHHSTINALRIESLPKMKKSEFECWLNSLPRTVLRGKGFIQLEEHGGYFSFQFSSGTLLLERIKETSRIQPTIILIGDQMNKDEIIYTFNSIFKTLNH